jgi:uncharacterized membrane protein YdfJ with MMPL/SSD domain
MKAVAMMVAAGFGSWLVASLVLDSRMRLELLCGMIGPLAGVSGSWVLIERTHRRNPQALTSAMIVAFGFKLVFFGAYVAVMLVGLSLRPVPFVASFVGYFCGLYLMEALYLQRLFK